jgi:hypothetical protein
VRALRERRRGQRTISWRDAPSTEAAPEDDYDMGDSIPDTIDRCPDNPSAADIEDGCPEAPASLDPNDAGK